MRFKVSSLRFSLWFLYLKFEFDSGFYTREGRYAVIDWIETEDHDRGKKELTRTGKKEKQERERLKEKKNESGS